MSEETAQQGQEVQGAEVAPTDAAPTDAAPPDAPNGGARFVPVAESIKYRRRAQQAEKGLQQLQQQLQDLQAQLQRRAEELAAAEAQRDEAHTQLAAAENRRTVERMLAQAGVVDAEAACLLLGKHIDLGEAIDEETLASAIEQLLLDRPYLRGGPASKGLPPRTASAKIGGPAPAAQLADAAERAAQTGDRRHVAEYLRLRRQMARSK